MKWSGSVLSVLLLSILFGGCTTLSYQGKSTGGSMEESMQPEPGSMPAVEASESLHGGEASEPVNAAAKSEDDIEQEASPEEGEGLSNQELIDSALEFCQASNDYWERGDLDNAVAALDKAYSLILKVEVEDDPDLLQQKEDLRFTISKRIVQVYASRFTVAAGDHNAIPLVMNEYVARELTAFKGREKDFFLAAYTRAGRFRPAIVKALQEAGMPEELSWLPLIESGFKVRALSRARALGMWQFIASTGYRFGLKRDQWVDERMDPQKSTAAAIAYLKELHQMFGDWTTALAAYNCGEMGVMNRIRTQRINYLDNFWDLYTKLPSETAAYVPRFLAVLHIVRDPAAHGMELPTPDPEWTVEEVAVHRQVRIKDVAAKLGVDPGILEEMNAELRHDVTPDAPYGIKVPAGVGATLLATIDQVPTHAPPKYAYSDTVVHKVRRGDSLSIIARKYRTSVSAIMAENGLKKNHILRVGSKLRVPASGRAVSPGRVAQASVKPAGEETKSQYVVKKGDSLWQIAAQFNTTAKELQTFNQLKSQHLSSGQVLIIPGTGETCENGSTKTYRVQGGDNPYMIARKHEMALADFLELNNLTPESTIFPGQTLAVKGD